MPNHLPPSTSRSPWPVLYGSRQRAGALGCLVALLCLLAASPARAVTAAVLLGPKLKPEQIKMVTVDNQQLRYFDSQRRFETISVNKVVQLSAIGGRKTDLSDHRGVLTLVDGQRFPGRPAKSFHQGQGISWQSPFGRVHVSADQIESLTLPAAKPSSSPQTRPTGQGRASTTQDVLRLANGDQLRGFVVSIDNRAVHIVPQGSKKPVALPIKRVRSIQLANNRKRPAKGFEMLTLTDGSRVLAKNLSIDDQHAVFINPLIHGGQRRITLSASRLVGVDFLTSGYAIVPLVSLNRTRISGGSVFGLRWPARRKGDALDLHAPISLRITLPDGAVRCAADITLTYPERLSAAQRRWAHCIFTLSSAGKTVKVALDSAHPTGRVNLPLSGHVMTLSLTPGSTDPILDRVRVDHGIVLTRY